MGVKIRMKLNEKRTVPRRRGEASSSLGRLSVLTQTVNEDKFVIH